MLDAAFKVVRQSFGTLAICVLAVAAPLNVIGSLIRASTSDDAFNLDDTSTTGTSGTEVAGLLVSTTLNLVLFTLAAAACFRAVWSTYLGQTPTWQASLSLAATRVLPLLGLSILYFLGVIGATILLVIPGVWLSVAWSLGYPALLSEGLGPAAALGRSFRLIRGRWWATFAALLVMYLIIAVISGILGLVVGATLVAAIDSEVVAAVLFTIVNIASSLITLPLFAAVLTIIYLDLRGRKEGFDLQLLAPGVGEDSSRYDSSPEAVGAAAGLAGPVPPPR
ncbi:MAG TPA: hypothetical protein VES79_12205, partial [Solirubrobacteraceae bacterium]|nr:hypothetical protein [Solirubrobacteraceae bacterium]